MTENNIFMPLKNLVQNSIIIKPVIYDQTDIPIPFDVNILKEYYWIVPPSTLLSYIFDDGKALPTIDQTIWEFTEVSNRYIFGKCYTLLDITGQGINKGYSNSLMYGSITPDNKVEIFFDISGSSVVGAGQVKKLGNNYNYFLMQMNYLHDFIGIHVNYLYVFIAMFGICCVVIFMCCIFFMRMIQSEVCIKH